MTTFNDAMRAVGLAALKASSTIGPTVADAYLSVDSDVMRHLAHMPLLGYSLFVSREESVDAGEPDGHPPLVFVHGLKGNRGTFLPMSWYLNLAGRKRSYKIQFDSGQSLEQMAEALAAFIRSVTDATNEPQVEMVAHSLGGIIARLAVQEHGLAPLVKTLITLGTPHRGTYPARFANTEATREIRPESDLVKRLNRAGWPDGVRGVTFWSRNDLFVLPAESAAADGTEQIEATPFTHYSYLIDPRCWAAVARALHGAES
jgi:triacylglycerol esterase/lipase EstA (alpha/beta hydrolase family)